jgi:hypothetical protein
VAPLKSGARAARANAARLRSEAEGLKLAVRGSLACSRERLETAQSAADDARAKRDEPLPSPWSELRWTQSYETLEQTLVPLPPPRSDS